MTETTNCGDCGMPVGPDEFHPFGACLMFKACKNSATVRANMDFMRGYFTADLTARLAEAERENDRLHGEAVAREITNDELRAEVARLKAKDNDADRLIAHWEAKAEEQHAARESAEARLTALREAVEEAREVIFIVRSRDGSMSFDLDETVSRVDDYLQAALTKSGE